MEVECPSCSARVGVEGTGAARKCSVCGEPLGRVGAEDAVLAELGEDLREAFGPGAYDALRPEEVARGSGSRGGGGAPRFAMGVGPIGERLGDFELLGELGRGGMGVVYRARQLSLDREVALKVLPPSARRNRAAVARFRRESQAAGKLHHTNIVPVYAQGEHDGRFYYAMELIEGESLDSAMRSDSSVVSLTLRPVTPPTGFRASGTDSGSGGETGGESRLEVTSIQRTRRDYRRIAQLIAEVADSLDYAHGQGVIHRDIKPHNLLLGQDQRLHITDFGLAHLMDEPHLTITGEVMGTPAYMSPEQVKGAPADIDHRTDVYSLGVSLYELLTLRRPFRGGGREQIIHRICTVEPQAPQRLDRRIPIDLETVCLRALEKDVRKRYATAGAMAEDLRRFADDRPILTRRTGQIEKGVKWVRRHKAASSAISAVALLGVAVSALVVTMSAQRTAEAARCLDRAYAHLVYHDFNSPAVVREDIERADELGADPDRLKLVQALATMFNPQQTIELLEGSGASESEDVERLYVLAWAYWRDGQPSLSRERFSAAEALGGANRAAEWFFRGLASQFYDPEQAIVSYQQARRMRARESRFYAQATMHVARARNQLMYRTRDISGFNEVRSALRELIEHEVYGAIPYYYLSIAYRLAAEVYAGNTGTPPETAEEYYAMALEMATRGEELAAGNNDAPLTARAEALESMGDFEEAVAARSAAIDRAAAPVHRWEGYHYRWRLYYWLNRYDEALADLEAIAALPVDMSESDRISYEYVYPMLVYADSGQMQTGLDLARELAAPVEGSSLPSALRVIWSGTGLRILGRGAEADALLADHLDAVDYETGLVPPQTPEWAASLLDFAAGLSSLETLLELSEGVDDPLGRRKLVGEAWFHAAAMALATGDRAAAAASLERSYRSFDSEKRYTYHAKVLRERLQADPSWPPWLDDGD